MQTLGGLICVVCIGIGGQQRPVAIALRRLAHNRIQLAIEADLRCLCCLGGLNDIAIVDGIQIVDNVQWHTRHKVRAAKEMLENAVVIRQQAQIVLPRCLYISLLHLLQIDEYCMTSKYYIYLIYSLYKINRCTHTFGCAPAALAPCLCAAPSGDPSAPLAAPNAMALAAEIQY